MESVRDTVDVAVVGKAFRCMYPGGEGEYSSLPGSGFLRLHSTYRHDLKVRTCVRGLARCSSRYVFRCTHRTKGGFS